MAEFKLTISDAKTGKSYSKALFSEVFKGKKLGSKIDGAPIGLDGYELQITGGSDTSGFPMHPDLPGFARKKALLGNTLGSKINVKGMKKRKTIIGNQITLNTAQINLKVLKYGSKSLDQVFGKEEKKEETKEEKKTEEKPKDVKKEEPKKEVKKETHKEVKK